MVAPFETPVEQATRLCAVAEEEDKQRMEKFQRLQDLLSSTLEGEGPSMDFSQWRASGVAEALIAEIHEFERELPPDHSVALYINGIGPMVLEKIHVPGPLLIIFRGTTAGKPTWIVQHVSQVSLNLTAVQTNQPRKTIGFTTFAPEEKAK